MTPLALDVRPVFRRSITAFAAALLVGLTLYLILPQSAGEELSQLHYPGESAGRMVERHLEFYEGYESTSVVERLIHTFLFGSRMRVEQEAIDVYHEVLSHYRQHPSDATPWAQLNTRARLLVTLAETQRTQELERELAMFTETPEEEVIGEAVRFAYGVSPVPAPSSEILTGASLMPLGWAADHLRMRIATKTGDARSAQFLRHRLNDRGERWRQRVLAVSAVVALLVSGGLLLYLRRRASAQSRLWTGGILDCPWTVSEGFAVFVRAGLLGVFISIALSLVAGQYFRPSFYTLWSTLFASIPMLWLIHRHLLRPRGLSFQTAFGLSLRGVGIAQFIQITLVVLALEFAGTLVIAWSSWRFGLETHWSTGLYERMIFGPWDTTVLSGVNMVVWAAVFEEIGFRGLVYVTLRSRLRPLPAAVISAALFSSLHLYSVAGFLSVFWSGLVLAFAFERLRSLLPGMLVHGAGNLLALSTVLLFYR